MPSIWRNATLAGALLAAACGDKLDPLPASLGFVCRNPASPFCPVQKVFVQSCARGGCHVVGGAAPMSLEPDLAYDNLINVTTISYCPNGRRVVPGDPDASCLWELVSTDVMPLEGGPLEDADKEIIRAWIAGGAER